MALAAGALGPSDLGGPARAASHAKALDTMAHWQQWRTSFVTRSGRVRDALNGGISHSEGQGYGMLLAAFHDDRVSFDQLWRWTRSELARKEDGLLSWRWDPKTTPHVTDRNNATDGDILVAWALAEAATRWPAGDYRAAAVRLADAIMKHAVIEAGGRMLILPGVDGFSAAARKDGPVINLSYWVFPAFEALAKVAPDHDWRRLADCGLDLVETLRFGPHDLPPDWASLAVPKPRLAEGFDPVFGWNALRVPFYIAASAPDWRGQRVLLAPFAALWADLPPAGTPAPISLTSKPAPPSFGSAGYGAVPAIVACAAFGTPYPAALKHFVDEPYYPATLRLLTLIAVRKWYPECLV
nr:glycosyl hydrolase family 8 [Jiella flava]